MPCPNCGADPCYHICPNSPHYYSPEQERMDDAFYGQDDMSERYGGQIDPAYEAEAADYFDDREVIEGVDVNLLPEVGTMTVLDTTDDIPF